MADGLNANVRFQEEFSAKIPALALLHNLGWKYLPPAEAHALRDGKDDQVVLKSVLRERLRGYRFTFAGEDHALTESAVEELIGIICTPALNEGLLTANEKLYYHLLYGIAVKQIVNGRTANPTIPLIDWAHPENNHFHFTEEYSVRRAQGADHRRPDIVCFVNGIPFVVIEAKRPDGHPGKGPTVAEGISQQLRNQRPDEIPGLFAPAQLLVSIASTQAQYGTIGTPKKFWSTWEDEQQDEAFVSEVKNKALAPGFVDAAFAERPARQRQWFEEWHAGGVLPTAQDELLCGLLSKERLLEFVRYFSLFDSRDGRIAARYPQFFGARAVLDRIRKRNTQGGREGGVLWHTTGSGKSYTMVFLSKALLLDEELARCRVMVITDRIDLERQLSSTFWRSGALGSNQRDAEDAMATSGRRLAEQVGRGQERLVFSLINKFHTAARLPECHNESSDIIVLIDEGHRSHGGETHARMRKALPNAALVAFTGTPLLKNEKTERKFGPILHAYTMQRAVEDGTVAPLRYEERKPDLDLNDRAIDAWYERATRDLAEEQQADLKRKFASKREVYSAEDRLRLIAADIAGHIEAHLPEPFKAQLACASRQDAIRYKRLFDELGFFESAVVISPPDTRKDNTSVDEEDSSELVKWWKENIGSQDIKDYTDEVLQRFKRDPRLKLIIVVDRLLTGFDEPLNRVLYIDKNLDNHNLLQAIARVNRLHEQKDYGLLVDYRGILEALDTTIEKYQDLAARTQAGYDIDDLKGIYESVSSEYKKLPRLHADLWACFDGVANKADIEALRQALLPKLEMVDGETVDRNQEKRDIFYERLTAYSRCLKLALESTGFYDDSSFTEKDRERFKATLKQMVALRRIVSTDAGETVDFSKYEQEVRRLINRHVVGVEVREPEGFYDVGIAREAPEDWSEEKARNEADLIKSRLARKIEQDLAADPYAKSRFSELLRQVIEEAEKQFDHPLKQYLRYRKFEEQIDARELPELPGKLADKPHAKAIYGLFLQQLPDAFANLTESEREDWVGLAVHCDREIDKAVAENSVNPQYIGAAIHKKLLPRVFQACKEHGTGIDAAKAILDAMVEITRRGRGRG